MTLDVKPLPFKPSRLDGLSERLLASHYENNYGGAVRRYGAIRRMLADLDPAAPGFQWNGLKREELIAANSALLHEVYFDGLGGDGRMGPGHAELAAALERDFGSVDRWRAEFAAMGRALGGGSGWVVLTWAPRLGRLVNQWGADHAHVLAGGVPVLALDMYEHAYHLDFGADAAAYVGAFLRNVAWDRAAARFAGRAEPALPPEAVSVAELAAAGAAPLIVDVRLPDDYAVGADMIEGAEWRDPAAAADWAAALPRDRPVAVYCVYGFHVSQNAVAALRARGIAARWLAGGIAAWRAAGLPTRPKPRH